MVQDDIISDADRLALLVQIGQDDRLTWEARGLMLFLMTQEKPYNKQEVALIVKQSPNCDMFDLIGIFEELELSGWVSKGVMT